MHAALEARLDLLSPQLDIAAYRELLWRFALVQPTIETAVEAAVGGSIGSFDVAACHTSAALRADLVALGLAPPTPLTSSVAIDSVPAAVGALYVTEGATLGGAVIAAHVRAVLGAGAPRSFFAFHGPEVGMRWARFRALAHDVLTDDADVEQAATTAGAVFEWFSLVLAP